MKRIKKFIKIVDWGAVLVWGLDLGISISCLYLLIKLFLGE